MTVKSKILSIMPPIPKRHLTSGNTTGTSKGLDQITGSRGKNIEHRTGVKLRKRKGEKR